MIAIILTLIAIMIIYYFHDSETFDTQRYKIAEKLVANGGTANFTQSKYIHEGMDAAEYYKVKNIMSKCNPNNTCVNLVYNAIN